ncbi:DUF3592 domain-containing protein [Muricoccus radiodurans]|uniref:DUF3592 domain-containing protein n=1 Tax=Muricoccus radiodurans TaxID=2231721 RepID=UPI003CF77F64
MDQTMRMAPAGVAGAALPQGQQSIAGGRAGRPPVKRWICVLGLLAAFGLSWGAWALVQDHQRAATSGIEVEGRMTGGYREVQSRRGNRVVSTTFYPSFSYRTPEGRVALATVSDSVEREEIRAGRTMPLRFVPGDPPVIRLASAVAGGPGAWPWVLAAFAMALGIPSAMGLLRRRQA